MNVYTITPRQMVLASVLVILLLSAIVYKMNSFTDYEDEPVATTTEVPACLGAVDMADPMVVTYLNTSFLMKPSSRDVPYNISALEASDHSYGQAQRIETLMHGKRNGFFIECGAHNGVEASNTLMLEHVYHWSGLLIEPSPDSFQQLVYTRRKAYLSPSCLSRTIYPEKVKFITQSVGGHIVQSEGEARENNTIEVQCFPLYSYLLALNRTTVDYLSLDVESNELDVLKTIPWDKVDIRTLSVEFYMVPEGKEALRLYMEERGYYVDSIIQIGKTHGADDYIFVKNNFKLVD